MRRNPDGTVDDADAPKETTPSVLGEIQKARLVYERARARREKLLADELAGSLIRLEDALITVSRACRAVRDALLAVPPRIAPEVYSMARAPGRSEPGAVILMISSIIERELRLALAGHGTITTELETHHAPAENRDAPDRITDAIPAQPPDPHPERTGTSPIPMNPREDIAR
jgi:hypothetical protein